MLKCSTCDDTGKVLDLHGDFRPCSRCCAEEFIEWSEWRRKENIKQANDFFKDTCFEDMCPDLTRK